MNMCSERLTKLYLRSICIKPVCPDIELKDGKFVFLGRNPLCQIKDKRVSKRHLKLIPNFREKLVKVEHLGSNNSVVNGIETKTGDCPYLQIGQTLQILKDDQYEFKLIAEFHQSSPNMNSQSAKNRESGADRRFQENPGKIQNWSNSLYQSIHNPELKVEEDDQVIVIKDKYPKARFHFLILPRHERINKLTEVTKEHHLDLIKAMHSKGLEISSSHSDYDFKLGYHAIPSMNLLHLHVISTDFVSDCLKTKKHWNSFNTDYFIPSQTVLDQIESQGKVETFSSQRGKELLSQSLGCHQCQYEPKNMPDLKNHLLTHVYSKQMPKFK